MNYELDFFIILILNQFFIFSSFFLSESNHFPSKKSSTITYEDSG